MPEEENKKNRQMIDEDVERLKEWLIMQPHLPHDIDEEQLYPFVYSSKSLEIAKSKLDNFISLRTKAPYLFTFPYRDPLDPAFLEFRNIVDLYYLPRPTPEGYRVLVGKIGYEKEACHRISQRQIVIGTMMMLELGLKTWPDMEGLVMIGDSELIDYAFMLKLEPATTAITLHLTQKGMPIKLKKIVYFNTCLKLETYLPIVRPFLSKKILDRVSVTTGGPEVLAQLLPLDMIPSDYGGTEKSAKELNDYWIDVMIKNREWFLKTSLQVSDETKRPADKSNNYGIEGTFRYLQID